MTFDKNLAALGQWANELVCPACMGSLRVDETEVVCAGCGRKYPVEDGIPVLIVERAEIQDFRSPVDRKGRVY